MKKMIEFVDSKETGQGMVEYSLVIALVIIGLIGAVTLLGDNTLVLYEKISSNMLSI